MVLTPCPAIGETFALETHIHAGAAAALAPFALPFVAIPTCWMTLAPGFVRAGFPSPADDYTEKPLSLDDLVHARSPGVFFVRVEGESMRDAGIHTGDVLVVDRAAPLTNGAVVVARLDGDFYVKRFQRKNGQIWLCAENEMYPPLIITEGRDFEVCGIVTYIVCKPR